MLLNRQARPNFWISRLAAGLAMAVVAPVALVALAAPASAAHAIESMPLWRLQIKITTADGKVNGTTGMPAVRLNSTATGVRWLNPLAAGAFADNDGVAVDRTTVHDLGLLASPSEITMLRLGVTGTDGWCVKHIELLLNGRTAFTTPTVQGGGCATIVGGTYVEYSGTVLRTGTAWATYGTPPAAPRRLSSASLRALVSDISGASMVSSPVTWDRTVPLHIWRRTASSVGVSYGVIHAGSSGDGNFAVHISYALQLYVGTDGRLRALKTNIAPYNAYHYAMSDAVTAQLDQTLSRMTAAAGPVQPTIDGLTNITW